jgi:hypothetical protein
MRALGGAILALGVALVSAVGSPIGTSTSTAAEPPKSRQDWPVEKVIVIGRRGNPRDWIANHTFRGMEGFADGSAPPEIVSRNEYPFQVYYAPDGKLEAHFRRLGARVPHGPIEELDYVEFGSWRITEEEGDLCQTIPKVGWGIEVCFWLERRGNLVAMYYTSCGAFNRCYPGRLGPEGELFRGRVFTR